MRRCSSHWGLALLDTIDRGRGGARATPKGGRASGVKYRVMYVSSLWWVLGIERSHSPLPVEAEVTENTREVTPQAMAWMPEQNKTPVGCLRGLQGDIVD